MLKVKYLKQFLIILGITFIGEILKMFLPLPIPASIYGMVIMLAGLMTGIIKYESVKETGKFLIEIMPIMFIPAGVGLINSWGTLNAILVPALLITVIAVITVMGATGWISQFIIRKSGDSKNE